MLKALLLFVVTLLFNYPAIAKPTLKLLAHYGEHTSDDFFFDGIDGMTITPTGELYVVDRKQNCLFKFDLEGNLLTKIGRKGQGPGEFNFPRDVIAVNDQIWVTDYLNARIQIFKNDQYASMIKLDKPTSPVSFAVIDDIIYVGGHYYINEISAIAKLNTKGEVLGVIKGLDVPKSPYENTAALWRGYELKALGNKQLLLGFNYDSLIVTASTAGKTLLQKDMQDYYTPLLEVSGPMTAPGAIAVSAFTAGPDNTVLMTICNHEVERNDCSVIYQWDAEFKSILNRWDVGESLRGLSYDAAKGLLITATNNDVKVYEFQ